MNPATSARAWGFESLHAPSSTFEAGAAGARDGFGAEQAATVWRLQRRCALSPAQFAACLGCVAALSLVLALLFWSLGAPLISGFLAVEVIVVAAAFAHHALHAADGEALFVVDGQLHLEAREGLRQRRARLALATLRVVQAEDGLIELRAPGRSLRVGRHAAPGQRSRVYAELKRLVPGGWAR